jgi:hypothetical protein
MNIEEQEVIHGWLECYVDALRADRYGLQATPAIQTEADIIADEIERDLQGHLDVFQPEKVGIKRLRMSTTQGSVELSYNGTLIERFGDDIRIVPKDASPDEYGEENGGWAGLPDSYWNGLAKRFFYEGRRDGHRLYPPLRTRDPDGLVAALEAAAEKVGRLRAPQFDSSRSWVGDLNRTHAKALAAGYMSGLQFRAVGHQVALLSGQVYGEIYWTERRQERKLDQREYLPRLWATLEKAIQEGRVKEETNERGAILIRGSISEERFAKFADPANGWEYLETGSEPYSQVAVNIDERRITSYSEGDHVTAECPSDEVFCKELAHAVQFWQRNNPSVMDDMTDGLKAWLEWPEAGFEFAGDKASRPAA